MHPKIWPPTPQSPLPLDSASASPYEESTELSVSQQQLDALYSNFNTIQGPSYKSTTSTYLPRSLQSFVPQAQLAPTPLDPLALLHPVELLPDFPYIASPQVANEAKAPDIMVADDGIGDERKAGGGPNRLGKKVGSNRNALCNALADTNTALPQHNEKLRRDAFKMQLSYLVSAIPGMENYNETRKSVLVCTREYITQLQSREKLLRGQLISHHLRERGLTTALLKRGVTIDQIEAECAGVPDDLGGTAADIESLISEQTGPARALHGMFAGPSVRHERAASYPCPPSRRIGGN